MRARSSSLLDDAHVGCRVQCLATEGRDAVDWATTPTGGRERERGREPGDSFELVAFQICSEQRRGGHSQHPRALCATGWPASETCRGNSSIGAERCVRPMQVRLMRASRVHADRPEGRVPCGKGDEPPRREADGATQGHACARRSSLVPCDRSGWQHVRRPIRRDGRVVGRALYRRAARSGRSRRKLRPAER